MKKKNIVLAVILTLCLALSSLLVACGLDNTSNKNNSGIDFSSNAELVAMSATSSALILDEMQTNTALAAALGKDNALEGQQLTEEEIEDGYEKNTGKVIVEVFEGKDVMAVPAVLCSHHGPFSWGKDGFDAVHNAKVLEECAKMALYTIILDNKAKEAPDRIKDKHYFRKHGKDAYYGQS